MPPSLKTLLPRVLALTFFVSMLGGHVWLSQRMAQLAAMPPPEDASFGWASDSEYTFESWVIPQRELFSWATYPSLSVLFQDGTQNEHRPMASTENLVWSNTDGTGLMKLDGLKPWLRNAFRNFKSPTSLAIPPPLRQIRQTSMMMVSSKSGPIVLPGWELNRLIDIFSFDEEDPSRVSYFTFAWNFRDSVEEHSKRPFSVVDVAPETGMTWEHATASSGSIKQTAPQPPR